MAGVVADWPIVAGAMAEAFTKANHAAVQRSPTPMEKHGEARERHAGDRGGFAQSRHFAQDPRRSRGAAAFVVIVPPAFSEIL